MTKAKVADTFPTLNVKDRAEFDLFLASMTRIERPNLVDLLLGGLNAAPIVDSPGKIGNEAWREVHADMAFVYEDETSRKNVGSEGPQVETVRAYCKRIAAAYREAFGKDFPIDAFKLTHGGAKGTVDFWRVR